MLIGGIHGGYEFNTVILMQECISFLTDHPEVVPPDLVVYVIPLANPDGAAQRTDRAVGRVNANGVDLNRNWDYEWQQSAYYGQSPIFAGEEPFSEPETVALRDFILSRDMDAVIFYHSARAEVYSGAGTSTSRTEELAKLMAYATGYTYSPIGIPGQMTTGDAIDWLTVNGVTAIEIELTTHSLQDIDWEENLRGLMAFLEWSPP